MVIIERLPWRNIIGHDSAMSQLQFLYRVSATRIAMLTEGPTPEEAAVVGAHFAYLQRLLADGVLLMACRTLYADETTFGIAVFVAGSEVEA
jgi:uncharacterized protein